MSSVMKKTLLLLLVLLLALTFFACGEEDTPVVDDEEIEELEPEHTHRWLDADCDTPKTCRICKETEGKAIGHDWKAATCIDPKICKTCGATEGDPLGHSTDAEGDRAATCMTKAYCSVCQCEYGEIDPDAHDMSEATCTEPSTCKNGCGYTEGEPCEHSTTAEGDRAATCTSKAYCSVCQSEYGEIDPDAHDMAEATCTEPSTCKNGCGHTVGDPLGHSTTAEGDRAATCTDKAYCSVCGEEYGEPLGHSTTAEGDRAATCTDKAYCSVCGEEYGEPLGHSTDAEGDRAATCTSKAYCSVCGEEYGDVDPDAHDMAEATCTEPSTCKNGCGHTEGEALGHDMAEATCTLPATCKNGCGHTEGKALGHDFSGEIFKDDAGHWYVCQNGCGATNKQAHVYGEWHIDQLPTETTAGSKTKTCGCGYSVTVEILPGVTESAPEVTDPEVTGTDFTLASDSVAQYVIISKNSAYDSLAESLAAQLTAKTGITFTFRTVEPTTGNKIYVGYSPKNLMADVARLSYNGYVFRASGSNIHITGHNATAIKAAVAAFAELAGNTEYWTLGGADFSKVTITMPGSILKTYNPESYADRDANLLGKHISNYVIVLPKSYSVNERFMAEALIAQIGKETGYVLEYYAENIATAINNPYKIVLGQTAMEYSTTVYDGLAKGSYRIQSDGTCIYIAYSSYLVQADAITALCNIYKNDPCSAIDEVGYPDYSARLVEKKDASHIRIMTTNIVAPADDGGQAMEDRYGITWKNRMQIQGEAIMLYLPDFIGFQELQQGKVNGLTATGHTELLKTIGDEYEMIYYDGLKKSEHFTPIAYRKSVWQVEDKGTDTSALSANTMHRWQWALFSKIDDPDTKYIIINLHYPISSMPAERVQAGQAVNALFKSLKEQYPDIPISITGDFNAEYGSDLFNLTVEGTDLKTGYMATADYGTAGRATIDHVLIENDDVTVYGYRMINDANVYMSSDHKPVFVDVGIGKVVIPTPGPDISWGEGEVENP